MEVADDVVEVADFADVSLSYEFHKRDFECKTMSIINGFNVFICLNVAQ